MKRLIVLLMFMFPVGATAAPIFPVEVNGEYTVTLKTLPVTLDTLGDPLEPATKSVELKAEGVQLLCQPMGNDEEVPVVYQLPNNNQLGRIAAAAFAWSNVDCTGLTSLTSNRAFHFFKGPKEPILQLMLTPTP